MSTRPFDRATLRRLLCALRAGDAAAVLAAGALASAAVSRGDAGTAARRACALLEAILLDPTASLPALVRDRLEQSIDDLLASRGEVSARLNVLWRELADVLAPASEPQPPQLTTLVQEYLAEHLGERVRLGDLARALGYSQSHLSAVVHRLTGRRFTVLRRTMQLDHAIFLLRRGSSVKQAALGAGFSDPAYFSRIFQRSFGVSPSRWRDRQRADRPDAAPIAEARSR